MAFKKENNKSVLPFTIFSSVVERFKDGRKDLSSTPSKKRKISAAHSKVQMVRFELSNAKLQTAHGLISTAWEYLSKNYFYIQPSKQTNSLQLLIKKNTSCVFPMWGEIRGSLIVRWVSPSPKADIDWPIWTFHCSTHPTPSHERGSLRKTSWLWRLNSFIGWNFAAATNLTLQGNWEQFNFVPNVSFFFLLSSSSEAAPIWRKLPLCVFWTPYSGKTTNKERAVMV